MRVIESAHEMAQVCRRAGRILGLVPTMGALHEGHLSLVSRARAENETLAVSVFVNPAQFGNPQDLDGYPKDLERDSELLKNEGTDLVFTLRPSQIYPAGFDTWIDVGASGDKLEGAHRPGHFRGVATVVAKLFNVLGPDLAYFGQKDGQQSLVIKQMVRGLDLELGIVVCSTIRQADGLAMSSRNARLNAEQMKAAPVVYRSLCRAEDLWRSGQRDAGVLRQEARVILEREDIVEGVDYVSVAVPHTLDELEAGQTRY